MSDSQIRSIVWDHGVLVRERLFGLADSGMPPFVQVGYAGLVKLIARLAFHTAAAVTPCASVQNVRWERWLGGHLWS